VHILKDAMKFLRNHACSMHNRIFQRKRNTWIKSLMKEKLRDWVTKNWLLSKMSISKKLHKNKMKNRDKCTSNLWKLSKKIRLLIMESPRKNKLVLMGPNLFKVLSRLWLSWNKQQLKRKLRKRFKTHNIPNVLRAFNLVALILFQIQGSLLVIFSILQ